MAMTALLVHERIEVEDTAVAAIRFKSGALGVIEAATGAYPGLLKRTEIHGENGSARVEQDDITLWTFRDERPGDAEIACPPKGPVIAVRPTPRRSATPATASNSPTSSGRSTPATPAQVDGREGTQGRRDHPGHLPIEPARHRGPAASGRFRGHGAAMIGTRADSPISVGTDQPVVFARS